MTNILALSFGFAVAGMLSQSALAVDYTKADNTTALTTASSYTANSGTPASSTDRILFDATWSAASAAAGTNTGALTVGSFVFGTMNGPVLINVSAASNNLGVANTTIDMSAATQDVTFGGGSTFRFGSGTGNHTFNVQSGRTLTFNTGINANGSSATLNLIGGGNIVLNGTISSSSTGNPMGLNVNGANVTLNAVNAFRNNASTTFALTSGTLNLGNDGALSIGTSGGTVSFGLNGGTLTAAGAARTITTSSFAVGGNFTIADNAAGAQTLNLASAVTLTGDRQITNNATQNVTFSGGVGLSNGATARTLTFAGSGTTIVSSAISNTGTTVIGSTTSTGTATSGSVAYSGTGTLTLSGTNTYTGATTITSGTVNVTGTLGNTAIAVNGGTLSLQNAAAVSQNTLTVNGGTLTQTVDNALGGTASLTVSSGTTTISNANNHSGITTLTGGTLAVGNDTALGTSAINFNGGTLAAVTATRNLSNAVGFNAATGITGTIGGSLDLTIGGTFTSNANTLTVNNSALTTLSGPVNLSSSSTNRTLTINGTGNATISGVIANGSTAAASGLTYSGSGLLTLSNANTYAGNTLVSSGVLALGNSLALQNSTLDTSGAGTLTTSVTTLTLGGLTGSTNLATAITTGYSSVTGITLNPGSGVSNSYSGTIANGAAGMALTKSGAGTQTLSVANSYTGGTTVNAGVLNFSNSGALGSGTVTLAGGTLTDSVASAVITNTINVTNTTPGAAIVRAAAASVALGTITGSSSADLTLLNDSGSSSTVMDLSGNMSGFSGTIHLTAGNSSNYRFNGTTANAAGDANAYWDLGAGVSVNRRNSSSNLNTISFGSLSGASTSSLSGGSGGTTAATTFVIGARGDDTTFAGVIGNGGSTSVSVTKNGTGTLTLTGANTYSGATLVTSGTLAANNVSGSATGSGNVTVQATATLAGNGFVGSATGTQNITIASGAFLSVGNIGDTSGKGFGLVTSGAGVVSLNGTVQIDIFGNLGGTSNLTSPLLTNDLLSLTSDTSVLLAGTLKITDTTGNSATAWGSGDIWKLLDWSTVSAGTKFTGGFTTLNLPDLAAGLFWTTSTDVNGYYISIQAAPEPSRSMLLVAGGITLLLRRRRA